MRAGDMIDRARKVDGGNRRSDEQVRAASGLFGGKKRSVENIIGSATRPTGTSLDAGLRRIRTAATSNNEQVRAFVHLGLP